MYAALHNITFGYDGYSRKPVLVDNRRFGEYGYILGLVHEFKYQVYVVYLGLQIILQELNQQLFVRNSHEVMLTEAGEILLPMARESIHMVDNCVLRLQELKQLLTGELNIGVTFSFSSIMAETMTDFMRQHPKVKLSVCYSSMEDLIERLLRHELDLVLAFKPNEADPRIESRLLFNTRLAAVVNHEHPLAGEKSMTLEDLQRYPLVLPTKGLQARNAFDRMTAHSGLEYNLKAEINNVNLILEFYSKAIVFQMAILSFTILINSRAAAFW